jgi:PKD repeat protein
MKHRISLLLLFLSLVAVSCYQEQEIPVVIDFEYAITEGSYTVPVELVLSNTTAGADFYSWTMEGATPSTSNKKQPGAITYSQAGTYIIKLEAWNDTQRSSKEITLQLDSAVTLNFSADILVNDFAPATVQITNNTRGASSYEWTFEGGTPETSTLADPPTILFSNPGEYTITLKISNGRELYTSTKTITVKEALDADFEIIPSFQDEDYEAPFTASLLNKTISGLRYTWSSTGGKIANPSAENAEIYFAAPGDYTVMLSAENDKETQFIEQTIQVKPNTNLYRMEDVKLGVSAAHTTIGCFYSTSLRRVFTKEEVNSDNGQLIDLVFYGINSSFSYCRFVSPDSAAKFTFPSIPQATHTDFVNVLEASPISFTPAEFDAMVDDTPLASLDIEANDSGTSFFSSSVTPRIVMFETADGRIGAIKIKNFVSEGTQSYILVDIKVQKLKR